MTQGERVKRNIHILEEWSKCKTLHELGRQFDLSHNAVLSIIKNAPQYDKYLRIRNENLDSIDRDKKIVSAHGKRKSLVIYKSIFFRERKSLQSVTLPIYNHKNGSFTGWLSNCEKFLKDKGIKVKDKFAKPSFLGLFINACPTESQSLLALPMDVLDLLSHLGICDRKNLRAFHVIKSNNIKEGFMRIEVSVGERKEINDDTE